jgi:hypothetical protein
MSFRRRWLGVPCGDLDPVAELDGQMPAMSQIAPIIADLVAETTRDHELGTAVHTMLRTPRHPDPGIVHPRRGPRELNPETTPELNAELPQSSLARDRSRTTGHDTRRRNRRISGHHAAWHKQRQQACHPCTNIAATSDMNHSGLPPLPSPLLSDRGRRQGSTPTAPEVGQLVALVRMARYFPDRASDSHRPSIRLLHSVFRVHQMLQRP